MLVTGTNSDGLGLENLAFGGGGPPAPFAYSPAQARQASDLLGALLTTRFQGIDAIGTSRTAEGYQLTVDLAHPVTFSEADLARAAKCVVFIRPAPHFDLPPDEGFRRRPVTLTMVLFDLDILSGNLKPDVRSSAEALAALKEGLTDGLTRAGFPKDAIRVLPGWTIELFASVGALEHLFSGRIGTNAVDEVGFVTAPRYPDATVGCVKYVRFGESRRLLAASDEAHG